MPNDNRIKYERTYIREKEKLEPSSIWAAVMTAIVIIVWVLQVKGVL